MKKSKPRGTPVTIRGETYHSQTAAAKALGVPASAIYYALERGTLDTVGLGRNYRRSIRMTVGGVEYPNINELSVKNPQYSLSGLMRNKTKAVNNGKRSFVYKGEEFTFKLWSD